MAVRVAGCKDRCGVGVKQCKSQWRGGLGARGWMQYKSDAMIGIGIGKSVTRATYFRFVRVVHGSFMYVCLSVNLHPCVMQVVVGRYCTVMWMVDIEW